MLCKQGRGGGSLKIWVIYSILADVPGVARGFIKIEFKKKIFWLFEEKYFEFWREKNWIFSAYVTPALGTHGFPKKIS